jgi:hypothetical protein
VIWFFEKAATELQLETRLDRATGKYTVLRRTTDGSVFVEEVIGEEPCRRLLRSIEAELEQDGWHRSRPPELLPELDGPIRES